jgi:hypothetical protein
MMTMAPTKTSRSASRAILLFLQLRAGGMVRHDSVAGVLGGI